VSGTKLQRHCFAINGILALGLFHASAVPAAAADDAAELYACTFIGHTPAGTLTGSCTTQGAPEPGYIARWKFTLTFDQQSASAAAAIKPDRFFDMLRGQCLEDGSFTTILPLWGDFLVKPEDPDYANGNRACAPMYQVAPSVITISRTSSSPLTLELLIEERPLDYNQGSGLPTPEWTLYYLESFQRMQFNSTGVAPQNRVSPQ
jgi:hypothetical protein